MRSGYCAWPMPMSAPAAPFRSRIFERAFGIRRSAFSMPDADRRWLTAPSAECGHYLFGKIAKNFALSVGWRQQLHFADARLLHRANLADNFIRLAGDASPPDCFRRHVLPLVRL